MKSLEKEVERKRKRKRKRDPEREKEKDMRSKKTIFFKWLAYKLSLKDSISK